CRSRLLLHPDLLHYGNRARVRIKIRALKAWIAPTVVAFRIFLGALHRASEKAAAQWAEWDETDAELTQQRNDARLEVALPQRILALKSRYRVYGVGASYRFLACFRESEKASLASVHEVGHRAHDVLDGHGGIDAMLIQKVYVIGLQPAQRAFHCFTDVHWPAIETALLPRLPDAPPELGRDGRLVPFPLQSATEQLLVGERTIHLCGIQKRDADLERAVQRGYRFPLITLLRRSI